MENLLCVDFFLFTVTECRCYSVIYKEKKDDHKENQRPYDFSVILNHRVTKTMLKEQ